MPCARLLSLTATAPERLAASGIIARATAPACPAHPGSSDPRFLCEPVSPGPRLTGRELEVAGLVAAGLTNQAIARRLSVAPRTAEAHVENIHR